MCFGGCVKGWLEGLQRIASPRVSMRLITISELSAVGFAGFRLLSGVITGMPSIVTMRAAMVSMVSESFRYHCSKAAWKAKEACPLTFP